jgi:uncharacterized membrane protein
MSYSQFLMATNAAAQLFILNTDSIILCTVTLHTNKQKLVKFVNHIYILCTDSFIWTCFEKRTEFHVTFFQSAYIWLIQTKLVLTDNRPTEFHQGHSAVLAVKHTNRWILHAHYTSFHGIQVYTILKLS